MRTLFVENLPSPGGEVDLERREAEHLFRVLRAAPGDSFRLLDGRGGRAEAEVVPGGKLRVTTVAKLPEPELKLHLFFAQPRRNRLDALLPACSELGVWELHPVVCARSVAEGVPNDRWRLQLVEGCKQSGNAFLPRVAAPEPLLAAAGRAAEAKMALFYGSVAPAAAPEIPRRGEVGWIVGPEGGFTPDEESGLRERGVRPLNLGEWVLRLETAAVCGLAVLKRLAMALLLCAVPALLVGCAERDAAKHPLTRKGDYYRDAGESALAFKFYRRAAEKFPDSPVLALKLATLCDESLDDPLAAAWFYSEYLRLAPESADRDTIAAYRRAVLKRLAAPEKAGEDAELAALREENRKLRASLAGLRQRLFRLSQASSAQPERYTVRSGDTPAQIAQRNRVALDELLRVNGLTRSSRLRVGQVLVLPRGGER